MTKNQDKDTRYYLDLDLRSGTVLGWDYDQRRILFAREPQQPFHHRIFLTKGQFNKLVDKALELRLPGKP